MKLIFLLVLFCLTVEICSLELKGLQFLIQFITGDFMESKKKGKNEKVILKNETSRYLDRLTYSDKRLCASYEIYETEKRDKRAKCIRANGNGTLYLLNSLNEVMSLLSPASTGGTKIDQIPGNCVVMLFYTKFCPGCLQLIPHWNSLARSFPDIKVGAIDALDHPNLNTELGIIGLPSVILFHNGRMIQKFNITQQATANNFVNFITTHTNLKPSGNVVVTSEDFSPTSPLKITMQEEQFDCYLWLSWIFIVFCSVYYFTRSRIYKQIVEMIRLNWTDAQM